MLWLLAVLALFGPTEMVQAQQRLKEGQKLMATERFEEAAVAFRDAIRLDPMLMMAYYGLGQTQMALKSYPNAITAFKGARDAFNMRVAVGVAHKLEGDAARQERARQLRDNIRTNSERVLTPDSPEARERDRRIMQWEQEIASLDRSTNDTRKTPDLPPGLPLALGSAYFRSGLLPDAEREYRAAVAIQPNLGEPHSNLAVVLLMTDRAAEAQAELKLAEKNGFKVNPGLKKDIEDALSGQGKAKNP